MSLSQSEPPVISVAIVSYNTCSLLRTCLQSLSARIREGEGNWEIIVADNGSTDGSLQMVRTEFPAVRLIETGGNIGFGRANNRALEDAQGRFFCLLNSDAEMLPGVMPAMQAYLEAHADVGLVGGQLVWPDGRLQISWGDDPTLRAVFYEQTFLSVLRSRFGQKNVPKTFPDGAAREVDQICGACMLIKQEAYRQIGGFDPAYFMYNEDVDLNVRLRQAGWKVVFLPELRIPHHLGASSSKDWRKRARMVSAYNASRYYFFTRFHGVSAGHRLKSYCLLGAAIRLCAWSLLSVFRPAAHDKVLLFREVWRRTAAMKPDGEA